MDTPTFLLKRDEILARMEYRRLDSIANRPRRGLLSLLVAAGSGVASLGLESAWMRSAIWAIVAPTVVGLMRNGGSSMFERLVHSVFSFKKKHSNS
jgi:hypothetical protein